MSESLKPKDLCGIPWRVAFALQADGWYLRSDIIWHKPNPMPESVTDRPTKSHEYIFLLTKKPRYYYDAHAIKEPAAYDGRKDEVMKGSQKYSDPAVPGQAAHTSALRGADRWQKNSDGLRVCNKRSVWTVATQSFPDAHFATFPEKLITPCILAGTSEKGCCPECGKPWVRVVEKERTFESGSGRSGNMPIGKNGPKLQGGGETLDVRRGPCVQSTTIGWRPGCECGDEPIPCTILDPFSGAGTTGLVAYKNNRAYIGIELSQEYTDMSIKRIKSEKDKFALLELDRQI